MLRIGVDGGGTTTRAVIIDDKLQELGRGEAASSNHYSVGAERAVQNILAAVRAAGEAAGVAPGEVDHWGLGLAGACTREEQTMLRERLLPLAKVQTLVVDEDAAAAQAGAFGGGPGAVCIAGTGANCFGINEKGERARADGLGPLLGDRGSGYWIGEQALRAVCRAYDGISPAPLLFEAVLAHFQVASVDELVQLVYRPDFEKDRIAALFPIVESCPEAVAESLLIDAGAELAATAQCVLEKLDVRHVAVSGGILGRETLVRQAFETTLRDELPGLHIQEPRYDAAIGAALLVR